MYWTQGTKTKSARYSINKYPYISRVPPGVVIVDSIVVY
jgi:hypothetical protein